MHSKLLVDSNHFMHDLDQSIRMARDSIQVQCMTFEGDSAGKQLIASMLASKAKRKQLLIDAYSKVVINDHFIFGPVYLKSSAFRKEVNETKQVIQEVIEKGVEVRYTNPLGFLMHRYPLRNHKKMVIIDQCISYIGGINFSDHNFEWHDAMIRLEDQKIGESMSEDFMSTWSGVNQSRKVIMGDTTLFYMNGLKSKQEYEDIFQTINNAKRSIDIFSPYVSDPLLNKLKNRKNRDVKVRIISPEINNKSIFKKHLSNELKKGYFELWHYLKGMSHLKAILIDHEILIMGSSNFDLISYYFEQEVIMISRDKEIISKFVEEIYTKDLESSVQVESNNIKKSQSTVFLMQLLNWAVAKGATHLLSTR